MLYIPTYYFSDYKVKNDIKTRTQMSYDVDKTTKKYVSVGTKGRN